MLNTMWPNETPLLVPDDLTWKITGILNGRDHSGDSYRRRANPNHVQPCDFCDQLILPCLLSDGREYDANIFVEGKELRVDIFDPHACEYSVRYREFLRSEVEGDWQ